MQRLFLFLSLVAAAALFVACGSGNAATPSPATDASPAAGGDALTIVANDLKFTPTEMTVPADAPFELTLDNQEAAPHNIAINDASGTNVFKGEIVSSTSVVNAVPALAAGTYPFLCEVHPDMKGTLTAG